MNKQLIIDADDFGLTRSVSKGILKTLEKGVVTSTNALMTSLFMQDSFDLAKEQGVTQMGIHLNLDVGHSLLFSQPFKRLPSFKNKGSARAIEEEFVCQIEALLEKGISLTHLTTHKSIITSKERVAVYAKLSQEYNVPVRRLPYQWMNDQLLESGCRMVNHRLINGAEENYSLPKINELLKSIQVGESAELICHVGYTSQELCKLSSLTSSREKELKLFLSRDLKRLIETLKFDCIPFSELN